MEKFNLSGIDSNGQNLILEAIHQNNLSNRIGYTSNFLDIQLDLPTPTPSILHQVAKNISPTSNGYNYLDYTHFSVMFNKDKKLPFLTAVNIDGATNELAIIHKKRKGDRWFQDDRIQIGQDKFQFDNEDYLKSGFQKGHMVRYYDPAWGNNDDEKKVAMGDTFHFTNCCPQIKGLNTGDWLDLEDYAMARAIFEDKKVTVFAGPVFNKAKKIEKLLVPINFWKIIVYKANDTLEAIGFLISHEFAFNKMIAEAFLVESEEDEYSKPTLKQTDIDRLFNGNDLKRWVVKIELIEEKTGLNFGLNTYDINKNKEKLFNKSIAKNPEFINEINKMKNLMGLESFDDTEFVKNI